MESGFFYPKEKHIILRVKVKPGAREEGILGVRGGELVVSVRAAPEKGKANAEVVRLLSVFLGIPRSGIAMKSGAGSSHKLFIVPLPARNSLERLIERRST
jgi:hypothetical protein